MAIPFAGTAHGAHETDCRQPVCGVLPTHWPLHSCVPAGQSVMVGVLVVVLVVLLVVVLLVVLLVELVVVVSVVDPVVSDVSVVDPPPSPPWPFEVVTTVAPAPPSPEPPSPEPPFPSKSPPFAQPLAESPTSERTNNTALEVSPGT